MRRIEVDVARGVAIILMIIYHFSFDVNYFGIAKINLYDLSWILFQRSIGTLFLLLVGISLTLSESRNKEGHIKHAKRALMLGAVAFVITIATWIYPNEGFVQFGIIHLIAVSTLLAPLFFRFRWMNAVLGLIVIFAGLYIGMNNMSTESKYLFWLGIVYPGYQALDHYPMLPWFGVVLIGIYLGQIVFPNGESKIKLSEKIIHNPYVQKLAFLGKNSLVVYLLHQPAMILLLFMYKLLFLQ